MIRGASPAVMPAIRNVQRTDDSSEPNAQTACADYISREKRGRFVNLPLPRLRPSSLCQKVFTAQSSWKKSRGGGGGVYVAESLSFAVSVVQKKRHIFGVLVMFDSCCSICWRTPCADRCESAIFLSRYIKN